MLFRFAFSIKINKKYRHFFQMYSYMINCNDEIKTDLRSLGRNRLK